MKPLHLQSAPLRHGGGGGGLNLRPIILNKKKPTISDGFFAESRSYGTPINHRSKRRWNQPRNKATL
jgi:hypothetical protein